jgi:hypothetical protein
LVFGFLILCDRVAPSLECLLHQFALSVPLSQLLAGLYASGILGFTRVNRLFGFLGRNFGALGELLLELRDLLSQLEVLRDKKLDEVVVGVHFCAWKLRAFLLFPFGQALGSFGFCYFTSFRKSIFSVGGQIANSNRTWALADKEPFRSSLERAY